MHSLSLHIPRDHPAFAGHFAGQPLLPGVSLLAEVLEAVLAAPALAARVGQAPRLGAVKFFVPVRPDTHLSVRFDETPGAVRFEVRDAQNIVSSGHFEAVA